jgi:hypothetical protein
MACYNCGIVWSAENGPKPSPSELRRQDQPQYQQYQLPQPQYQPAPVNPYLKRQTNNLALFGIILVIIIILVPISFGLLSVSTSPPVNNIAGPLDGLWETSNITYFYMKTDWQSGQLENVGYEARMVTFVITGTSDPNKVDVQMTYVIYESSIQNNSFYMSDPSPEHYDGQWSGSALWLSQDENVRGVFDFTDTTMTGTWDDLDMNNYFSQYCYTNSNGLELQRRV